MERLGVDIGRVIIARDTDERRGGDRMFGPDFIQTKAVDGAIPALARLVAEKYGPDGIDLVSKCGEKMEVKTRLWLSANDFYALTGIRPENVFFCRRRDEKAPIAEERGLSAFIDDRLEILGTMPAVPRRYLFDPDPKEQQRYLRFLPEVTPVAGWREVLRYELGA